MAISGERAALPESQILEVCPAVAVRALPTDAPGYVLGAISYRGQLVPVLDISACLGGPRTELTASDHFVIAQTRTRVLALHVSRAIDLISIPSDQIERGETPIIDMRRIGGVAKLPDGLLLIHDLDRLLTDVQLQAVADAIAPTAE